MTIFKTGFPAVGVGDGPEFTGAGTNEPGGRWDKEK